MNPQTAIINPVKSKHAPTLGKTLVMVSSRADLETVCRQLGRQGEKGRPLFTSRLFAGPQVSVVGPLIGAPYAVMLLETLVAWGADTVIFLGWCGAISPSLAIGDIVLATAAVVDEGTSPHYGVPAGERALPSPVLLDALRQELSQDGRPLREGTVWSTDAIYRETREKVAFHQERQVLAVEMELSALFAVGAFRRVAVAGVLVVSDELADTVWRPGFADERFIKARADAAAAIERVCRTF